MKIVERILANKSVKKHIVRPLFKVVAQDRENDYPNFYRRNLTPKKLARLLRAAEASGDISAQAELFEEIESADGHFFSILQTRKNAVANNEWVITPYSDEEPDVSRAKFVTEVIQGIENFEDARLQLLDSISKGFAVEEIMWKKPEGASRNRIKSLKFVEQKYFTYKDHELKLLVDSSDWQRTSLTQWPDKFIVHNYTALSGSPAKAGLMRILSFLYVIKHSNLRSWLQFAEVYGMPLRIGRYPEGTNKDDRTAILKALKLLGTNAYGILPEGADIEFKEANRGSSVDVYDRLKEFCNSEASKAVLGQTETSDSDPRNVLERYD